MAEYTKSVGGAWLDADKIQSGAKVKIVNECEKQTSGFKDPKTGEFKIQNVAKVRVQGDEEAVNMRFNWTTIYGLIDAFGTDSKDWIGHVLTARTVDAMVGDTMRTIVYLVPEGFELAKNSEKKLEIRKVGGVVETPDSTETINPEDIPF